ncbi:hypothetical protein JTB14_014707 [Gonioctena quinquepunctata]|nr:hypothetical protein JTB14_014707 [Gonioctena quinquepunctata]
MQTIFSLKINNEQLPDNGESPDNEESQGATEFDKGLTRLRNNPSRGDSLERDLGSDDFLTPPGVRDGWIYRLEKPGLMKLSSSLQINPEGTVIELRRRLVWHLVELPKVREITNSPKEGAGTYFIPMGRQNNVAVLRRDLSNQPPPQTNIPNPWRSFGMIPPTPEFDSNECFRPTREALTNPSANVPPGFALGHPGYPIASKAHILNVKCDDQDEAAASLERLEGISEMENIPKHRFLTALLGLLYGKALM